MRITLINIVIILSNVLCFYCNVQAQEKQDTVCYKNVVKIDYIPIQYDVSYYHQLRIGIEYERCVNNKSFASCYLDLGIYDEYTFKKYYDFFNQNQGLYYVQQDVLVKGFHVMPAYNYFLLKSKIKPNQGVYAGVIMDFHYYQKTLESFNSKTLDKTLNEYFQIKLGMGICLGAKYNISKHFFTELKTSVFVKIIKNTSAINKNEIRPLNAQWVDSKMNFWWVSNIMIGYAF